jgi:lipopolysaccharide/colanic/teichoic acid biosynthesis glycosyltransferase
MWKFRCMVHDAPEFMTALGALDEDSGPVANKRWVTPAGHFLRQTMLEELPQLWNVLLGDMSLVGPRPMSAQDVSLFNEGLLMRRFSVRPGITGNWQVVDRSSLSADQCVELDFAYIDDWSLGLDLKILARTVPTVLRRSGAV